MGDLHLSNSRCAHAECRYLSTQTVLCRSLPVDVAVTRKESPLNCRSGSAGVFLSKLLGLFLSHSEGHKIKDPPPPFRRLGALMESFQGRLFPRRKLFVTLDVAGAARHITCTNRSSRCHDASSFRDLSKLSSCVPATPAKAYQFPRPCGAVSATSTCDGTVI
jgi:hypothetical protein